MMVPELRPNGIVIDPELLVTELATPEFDIEIFENDPLRADTGTATDAARYDDVAARYGGPPSPVIPSDLIGVIPAPLILDDALIASMATGAQSDSDSSGFEIPKSMIGGYPFFDLKNSQIAPLVIATAEPIVYTSVMDDTAFIHGLDQMQQDLDRVIEEQNKRVNLSIEATAGFTLSLTAGFVSWVLRAGSLLSSFLSVVPLWKQLDPLPILSAATATARQTKDDASQQNKNSPDEQERVEKMFEQSDRDR
jgi:hypothetical protein